ncbi:MAG: pyocin knob domain-containing protein [Bacteroidota bacterium]
MKSNMCILFGLLSSIFIFGQTNTFPSSGNVGIGTTTPDGKLHVNGSNANTTNLVLSANYEDSYRWRLNTIDRGNAIDLDITSSDAGDSQEAVLKLSRSSSTRPEFQLYNNAIVANNGNVGIGNAVPSQKLDVTGNILANTVMLRDPINTSDWNSIWQSGFYQSYNATNAPEAGHWFWGVNFNHSSNSSTYRYNGQIAIKNSSTNPTMYFRSTNRDGIGTWSRVVHAEGNQMINGSLGIGTANPGSYKLAVKGKIRAEEIKVETGWADYVFKQDYDLPTLEEVEKHIQQKGHLINIPSAEEVEENGIQLGEMNKLLLEKIEELTLYTLQQQKQIDDYEQNIHQLIQRVEVLEKHTHNLKQ